MLRLAHTRSGVDTPVQDLVARFRALHPDTTLSVVSGWTEWNVRQVQAGAVDLAFVRLPVAEPGLVRMHLTDEELVAVLPAGHPLSRTRRLRPAHLRDEPVAFWPPTQGPGYHDAVIRRIWPDGRPKIVREDPDAEHVLVAVAAGTGLTILGRERAARLHPKGTTLRRFTHPPPHGRPVGHLVSHQPIPVARSLRGTVRIPHATPLNAPGYAGADATDRYRTPATRHERALSPGRPAAARVSR
ncbi:hypothetical protein SUDANB95_01890 [Actinosynnema sp. ALI-1.44]